MGRLLFLGSSCIYPKFAEQPIRSALYAIHQELHGKAWAEGIELVPVLADVADRPRIEMLLRRKGFAVVGSMENPPTIPRAD